MLIILKFDDYNSVSEGQLKKNISLLPVDRQLKAQRYVNRNDQISCAVSYLMLISILRNNFGIYRPRIGYDNFGKPFLEDYPDIWFNISHCQLGCVCAVANKNIGVDIQDIRDIPECVIEKVCHKNEKNLIRNSSSANREFAKIWAMKESYVKMLGVGIATELDKIDTTKLSNKIKLYDFKKYFIAVTIQEE